MSEHLTVLRLAGKQTKIELKRHYKPLRAMSNLIAPILIYILIKMGLPEWIGGTASFQWILAAYLAAALSITGMITLSATIIGDQEDGTLLRAKTLPAGLPAHLIVKVIVLTVNSLLSVILILGATYLAGGDELLEVSARLLLLVPFIILAVGVTAPMGLIAGGLSKKITSVVYISLFGYLLVAISDVFLPPGMMPDWLVYIARVFPFYWLGYLSRYIMLDSNALADTLTSLEWTLGLGVLAAWLLVGVIFTPAAFRSLSRRQSGRRLEQSARTR